MIKLLLDENISFEIITLKSFIENNAQYFAQKRLIQITDDNIQLIQ